LLITMKSEGNIILLLPWMIILRELKPCPDDGMPK
jgi:hypothetical protein